MTGRRFGAPLDATRSAINTFRLGSDGLDQGTSFRPSGSKIADS
jgi:hypothetical protein